MPSANSRIECDLAVNGRTIASPVSLSVRALGVVVLSLRLAIGDEDDAWLGRATSRLVRPSH